MDICALCFNNNNDEISQYIIAFGIGMIFSPFSYGFIFYILGIIIFESILFYYTRNGLWNPRVRLTIILFGFLGWLTGRILSGFKRPLGNGSYCRIHNRIIETSS